VWRQSITLLEGPQASPACPSGKSIMKYKWTKQKILRKKEKKVLKFQQSVLSGSH
jgi:hypothetical protein